MSLQLIGTGKMFLASNLWDVTMNDKTIYFLSEKDVQTVAITELGRELSRNEITLLEDKIAENIPWFDAIADAIRDVVPED